MNYDQWKLMCPDDEGYSMVSVCCGAEYWESSEWEETEESYICNACDMGCEIIEDYEYKAMQRENYLEDMRDE